MRLSKQEIQNIIIGLEFFLNNHSAELYLFGSRVNDTLRGGDIDLLLMTETVSEAESLKQKKHHLLANIKKFLGDQKIDLIITDPVSLQDDSFLMLASKEKILLKKWEI